MSLLIAVMLAVAGCDGPGKKSDALRFCLDNSYSSTGCYVVPFVLKCRNVADTVDTSCIVVTDAGYFRSKYMGSKEEEFPYPDNMDEMSERKQIKLWKNKCDKFYRMLIDNNMTLDVDSVLYADYYPDRVVVDKEIEALYKEEGIVGVLNKYLDAEGWLDKDCQIYHYVTRDTVRYEEVNGEIREYPGTIITDERVPGYTWHGEGVNVDYIIYLASLHNIYFYLYYHLPDEYQGHYIALWDNEKELKGLKYLENRKR